LQGKIITIFDDTDKVDGFKKKLKDWVVSIKTGILNFFPLTKGCGEEPESDIPADIINEFEVHPLRLIDAFNSYFPKRLHENIKESVWVVEPYSISKTRSSLTSQKYECLLALTSDTAITSRKLEQIKTPSDGLKEASRCWNKHFEEFLPELGFKRSEADPCLYIRDKDEKKLIVCLYVDDGLVAATDLQESKKNYR
ncbi:hypothetical protein AVEN_191901-1, partial [Araneus ventricosus]